MSNGWNQRLAYPDTTLVLGSSSGIAKVGSADAVSLKVFPNPFEGRTESLLQVSEDGEVNIRLLRVNGSVMSEYSGFLQAGVYMLNISSAEPQVVFLSVATRSGRSLAKMVNKVAGGSDRIVVAPTNMLASRQSVKAVAAGPFGIGDQMRYTAVSMSGGERNLSTPVVQSQTASGLVTLAFVIPTSIEWIDLGLPSGLLWYSVNLGATNPEGYGDYYAWGETSTKSNYNWITYVYSNNSSNQLTKYCNNSSYGCNGFTDNLTTLQSSDDAATVVLGGEARIPTKAEWQELLDNTTAEWTTVNNVYGRKFTASNGNRLFLPAAGYRYGSELYDAGEYGGYWSSSLDESYPGSAWNIGFYSGSQGVSSYGRRSYGFSVRAVRSKN